MTEAARPVAWQMARVDEIRELTPRIKSFFLALSAPIDFAAGQHADVRLTAEDGYVAMRSYSIASAPGSTGRIELAVERLDDGEVSPFFHDVVAVGDEIELRAPLGGHFVWRASDGGPLLLVGAGSGVVPLVSMIRQRHATGRAAPVALVMSAKSWAEAPFADELRARQGGGFTLVLALTRDAKAFDDVPVFDHRIDDAVLRAAIDRLPAPPRHVFVCGSNGFVNTAADLAIGLGVPAAAIRTERYGA